MFLKTRKTHLWSFKQAEQPSVTAHTDAVSEFKLEGFQKFVASKQIIIPLHNIIYEKEIKKTQKEDVKGVSTVIRAAMTFLCV